MKNYYVVCIGHLKYSNGTMFYVLKDFSHAEVNQKNLEEFLDAIRDRIMSNNPVEIVTPISWQEVKEV